MYVSGLSRTGDMYAILKVAQDAVILDIISQFLCCMLTTICDDKASARQDWGYLRTMSHPIACMQKTLTSSSGQTSDPSAF